MLRHINQSVYFGIIQFPFCDTKRIVKKRERVSKSVLCANATKRIVAFPDRLSTIRFVSTKRIVEKVAPQTVLLNSGEVRGLVADSRSETKGRSPLLQDRFCSGTTRWVGLHRWVGWGGARQLVL